MKDAQKLNFQDLRREYSERGLHRRDLKDDPFDFFSLWFKDAISSGVIEPNAFTLGTATANGKPSCRVVLMKHFDKNGLFFFTNYGSRKSMEINSNPYAAATFWWGNLERQIRIEGTVVKLDRKISETYFSQRPRSSQIGSYASNQDAPVHSKEVLKEAYERVENQFKDTEIPCPLHWGGFKIVPSSFEFWQGNTGRLHDRFLYLKKDNHWSITRLSP